MRAAIPAALAAIVAVTGISPAAGEPMAENRPTDALGCMTAAIYYEAAREPDSGQQAVARVVLNRLVDPAYPKSVCAVIFQGAERRSGCQFTFTCDGALRRRIDPLLWTRAGAAANAALDAPDALPGLAALNYHADYVRPVWAAAMREETRIGRHIFYTRGANSISAQSRSEHATISANLGTAVFSAWGLPIARLAPAHGGISVSFLGSGLVSAR